MQGGGARGVFGDWLRRARAAFLCRRGFTGGGWWGLGRVGKCGRLCGRFDNCSSGGSGSEFHDQWPDA